MKNKENMVKAAFDRHGITPIQAHKRGIPYQSAYRQYRGERFPSGEYAVLYEKILGIPRWEIRPDLWDAPCGEKLTIGDAHADRRS